MSKKIFFLSLGILILALGIFFGLGRLTKTVLAQGSCSISESCTGLSCNVSVSYSLTYEFDAASLDCGNGKSISLWVATGNRKSGTTKAETCSYSSSGSYTEKAFFKAIGQPQVSCSKTISVGAPAPTPGNQPPTVSWSANTTSGNAPLVVTFSYSISDPDGTISSTEIDYGDGSPKDSMGSGFPSLSGVWSYTYQSAGTYIAKLTVIDSGGAAVTVYSKTITVSGVPAPTPGNQPPTVEWNASPTSGNAPLAVTFTYSISDPDGTIVDTKIDYGDGSTTATFGSGFPSRSGSFTYTYKNPGTYTAKLTVFDSGPNNNKVEKSIIITVLGTAQKFCSISASPTSLTSSGNTTITANLAGFTASPSTFEVMCDGTKANGSCSSSSQCTATCYLAAPASGFQNYLIQNGKVNGVTCAGSQIVEVKPTSATCNADGTNKNTQKCDLSCGSDQPCNGKSIGESCGSGTSCNASCKCINPAPCSNQCNPGQKFCQTPTTYWECVDQNNDGCFEWSAIKQCPSAKPTCQNGECIAGTGGDTAPPQIFDPKPQGTITDPNPMVSFKTDEPANCREDSDDKDYDSMAVNIDDGELNTFHQIKYILGADGQYGFNVRCKDSVGNKNTSSFVITFVLNTGVRPMPPESDTTPPVISNPQTTGVNTLKPTITVQTDEGAHCGIDTTDKDFDSMVGHMIPDLPAKFHSKTIEVPKDGTYTLFVRCRDFRGNKNISSTTVTFTVSTTGGPQPSDTTPPQILNPQPAGPIQDPAPRVSVQTNEPATCKMDLRDKDYDQMAETMERDSAGTTHSKLVYIYGPDGIEYKIYVRCKDSVGNKNTSSITITFTLNTGQRPPANPNDTTPPVISNPRPTGTVSSPTQTISVETDEGAICKWAFEDKDFDSMQGLMMPDTSAKKHTGVAGLTGGDREYVIYVRCQDFKGNKNPSSTTIRFTLKTGAPTPPPTTCDLALQAVGTKVCQYDEDKNGFIEGGEATKAATDWNLGKLSDAEIGGITFIVANKCNISSFCQVAPPPIKGCTDTDGGKNYTTPGEVKKGNVIKKDSCDTAGILLTEYYCTTEGEIASQVFGCSKPGYCKEGACTAPGPGEIYGCLDSDGGMNYGEKGTVKKGNVVKEDACDTPGIILTEYYCTTEGEIASQLFACTKPGYCKEGACTAPGPGEIYGCLDSDGGMNYGEKGTVTKGETKKTDFCHGGGILLREYYCTEKGEIAYKDIECPEPGRCLPDTGLCVAMQPKAPGDIGNAVLQCWAPSGRKGTINVGEILDCRGTSTYKCSCNWKLDFGDGTVLNSSSGRHAYSTPGKYKVTFTASLEEDCKKCKPEEFERKGLEFEVVPGPTGPTPTAGGCAISVNLVELVGSTEARITVSFNELPDKFVGRANALRIECGNGQGAGYSCVLNAKSGTCQPDPKMVCRYDKEGTYTLSATLEREINCSTTVKVGKPGEQKPTTPSEDACAKGCQTADFPGGKCMSFCDSGDYTCGAGLDLDKYCPSQTFCCCRCRPQGLIETVGNWFVELFHTVSEKFKFFKFE